MMQSRSREKAMLATVSKLRRLLRNADLATKPVRVMGMKRFYTARKGRDVPCGDGVLPRPACAQGGLARRGSLGLIKLPKKSAALHSMSGWRSASPGLYLPLGGAAVHRCDKRFLSPSALAAEVRLRRIKKKFSAAPAAESCPTPSEAPHPQSGSRAAACGGQADQRQSRKAPSQARPSPQSPRARQQTRKEFLQRRGQVERPRRNPAPRDVPAAALQPRPERPGTPCT